MKRTTPMCLAAPIHSVLLCVAAAAMLSCACDETCDQEPDAKLSEIDPCCETPRVALTCQDDPLRQIQFPLLVEALRHRYDSFTHHVWTATGLILVALGWLLTSAGSRSILVRHDLLRGALTLATLVLGVVHGVAQYFSHRASVSLREAVCTSPCYSPDLLSAVNSMTIANRHILGDLVLTGTGFLFLLVFIQILPRWKEPASDAPEAGSDKP